MNDNEPPPRPPPGAELAAMLSIAREHNACEIAEPYIAGDRLFMPFDVKRTTGGYALTWEHAANRRELLDILGY